MAARFSMIAGEYLKCPVCLELFRDPNTPKSLDCSHVCCAMCIQYMIEGGKQTIDCPECRHVTRIPEKGVAAMKTELRLRGLAEKHEEYSKKTQANQTPSEREKQPDAARVRCSEHNISIVYYCKECNVAGCIFCMANEHNGPRHDFDEVEKVQEKQKECMAEMFNKAEKEIEESKQSVEDLIVLQDEMKRHSSTHQENIRKAVALAIKMVKEEEQTLIDNYNKIEQHRLDHIVQETKRLLTQIEEATDAKNTIEKTLKEKYVVKYNEIVQTVSSALGKDTKGHVMGMTKYVHDKSPNVKGNLGRIVQLRVLKCDFMTEFGEFEGAFTIAVTQNGSLVVSDFQSKQVYIYSRETNGQYKKQTRLALSSTNTTEKPYGVAVTAEGKYLVARETHVELYSPSGKYDGTLNFRKDNDKGKGKACANKIKLMHDSRIIISDWNQSNLIILSQAEIVLGTIHPSISQWHIATMSHEHIAVSDYEKGKVCVIHLESKRKVQIFDIADARGLCYHEQTDCLLVGRCTEFTDSRQPKPGTGVIEQYCATTGRLVACIAEGLYKPCDMTFTPDGMLAVADVKTVKVYKVV